MIWALIDDQNIVQNIIVYNGSDPYDPPEGSILHQINPWVQIGQPINTPQPTGE